MKEFLVGLALLFAVLVLSGLGFILLPFIAVLAAFLRILIAIFFVIFSIWLLGKLAIIVWEKLAKK